MCEILAREQVDIWQGGFFFATGPGLRRDKRGALTAGEFVCEEEDRLRYPPVLDPIRALKQIGIDLIVAPDTCFSRARRQVLLRHNPPDIVYPAIDRVVCSNERRRS